MPQGRWPNPHAHDQREHGETTRVVRRGALAETHFKILVCFCPGSVRASRATPVRLGLSATSPKRTLLLSLKRTLQPAISEALELSLLESV